MKYIKLLISLFIVFIIIINIDINKVNDSLVLMSFNNWAFALFFVIVNGFLAFVRWYLILDCLNAGIPWKRSIKLFYLGMSLNQLLPTSLAGELYKYWNIKNDTTSLSLAAHSIAIEKSLPLINLFIMIIFNLYWLLDIYNLNYELRNVNKITLILLFSILIFSFFIYYFLLRKKMFFVTITKLFLDFTNSISVCLSKGGKFFVAFSIGFIMFYFKCVSIFIISKFLFIDLSLANSILIFPLIFLISAIPISVSGWGLREGSMIILLSYINISKEQAVSLSFVIGISYLIANVPALLLLFRINKREFI